MRIYLGSIPYGTGPAELKEWLKEKGVDVIDMSWPRNENGLRPFCFIEVADDKGERTIQELDGQVFSGRPINVSNARPRRVI